MSELFQNVLFFPLWNSHGVSLNFSPFFSISFLFLFSIALTLETSTNVAHGYGFERQGFLSTFPFERDPLFGMEQTSCICSIWAPPDRKRSSVSTTRKRQNLRWALGYKSPPAPDIRGTKPHLFVHGCHSWLAMNRSTSSIQHTSA